MATRKSSPKGKAKAETQGKKPRPKQTIEEIEDDDSSLDGTPLGTFIDGMTDITASAIKMALKTREAASDAIEQASAASQRVNRSLSRSPEQLRRMADAGESLRDAREVAGLTLADLSKALNIRDKSFLEAVEDGREALSLEMILRMTSLYARNDPVPFATRYIRTYRPQLWETLEEWGLDKLPVYLEREREFINLYRSRDEARRLSDEGHTLVLEFTEQAFEMALQLVAEQEGLYEDASEDESDEASLEEQQAGEDSDDPE